MALVDVEEAVDSAGHSADPQALSVGQHPPPKLAGQDLKPVLQLSVPCGVVLEALSVDVVVELGDVVVVVSPLLVVELALDVELVRVLVVEVEGGRVVVIVTVLLTTQPTSWHV